MPLVVFVGRTVVVSFGRVIDLAKIAMPFRPIVREPHERIDVSATFTTAHDWVVVERHLRNWFPAWQLTVWLN